jgi:hypothetical protein|tara:strand:- start:2393 stop:2968 length:576 start_codon:yes stop_codon:yes gene_type:complete
MNNEYILTLPNLLDIDYMKKIGLQTITDEWLAANDSKALKIYTDFVTIDVESDEYLKSIRDKFPKLFPYIKIMKMDKGRWPAHIDTSRQCAINIPIQNCNYSKITRFGKNGKVVESLVTKFGNIEQEWHSHEYITFVEEQEMDFQFSMQVPTLINTKTPHQVINFTDTKRVILSWSYDDTFEQAKQDLLNE